MSPTGTLHPARIAELLSRFLASATNACHSDRNRSESDGVVEEPAVLSPVQLQNISTYIDILLRWNARINLTAVRDPEQIVTRHFGESLFAARHLFPRISSAISADSALKDFDSTGPTLADLGSGSGFPGLPIKLWAPHIHLTLIESNHKKAAFLREVVRALTLTNVNVWNGRAEDLVRPLPPSNDLAQDTGDSREANRTQFDVITLRAVERLTAMLPIATSLLAPAGRLALLIGMSQVEPVQAILPHLSWDDPIPVPHSTARCVLLSRASLDQVVEMGAGVSGK